MIFKTGHVFLMIFPPGKVSPYFLSDFLINATKIFANFKRFEEPRRFKLEGDTTESLEHIFYIHI